MATAGELLRMIQDLRGTVRDLRQSYQERRLPVTDGSRELHGLCAQLEFLLQFDLKEKRSFFGQRRDYWDFLCQGLARQRQGHEGVRFVSSLEKLRTPVGKGRAFLRYCLVHRQLAEALQLCFLDPQATSEWYYARSPFLHPQLRADILGCLYELDGVAFHLALRRADLDTAWPMASETLPRLCSPRSSQEGTARPVGSPAGACETQAAARRGPQEGLVSRSPGLSSDDQLRPSRAESEAASLESSQQPEQPAGSQRWEEAGDGKAEVELLQAQRQVEVLGRELEAQLARQEQRHTEERGRLQQEVAQHRSQAAEQARRLRELQDSRAFLSSTLQEMAGLLSTLRQQLTQEEEEAAALRAAWAQELAEGELRQQELARQLAQARRDAEQEAAAAACERQAAQSAAEALEEAKRRLRALEAEQRRRVAGAAAQELRHQQLREMEERLAEQEAQVAALQHQLSQARREGPSGCPQPELQEEAAQRAALEDRLRQAELQAEGLRGKLERALAERRQLELEREALLESAESQGQSLAAARLQARDVQTELVAGQAREARLQVALEQAERALAAQRAETRGLQGELEGQAAKPQEALSRAAASLGSEQGWQQPRGHEERAGHGSAVAEPSGRLAPGEEEGAGQHREEQRLQAALRGAADERDALARRGEESDGRVPGLEKQSRAATPPQQAGGQLPAVPVGKDTLQQTLARATAEPEQGVAGGQPDAGEQGPLGLAGERGAAKEKAAGGAGPQAGRQTLPGEPLEELGAAAAWEEAPEQRPRKGDEKMVKHLSARLEQALGEAQQKQELLKAKEEEVKLLQEQLGR
ncbi:RUN and FYVE domain-containing protein 4 isoform X2 [Carettochelys insculpta]